MTPHGRGEMVIYISEDQLHEIDYLINQSIQGNHILFDTDAIRTVFRKPSESQLSDKELTSGEKHLENLILQPSLIQKKAYLERLDRKTYENVLRIYFNIVENNIHKGSEVIH